MFTAPEIIKGLNCVGLDLSEAELQSLQSGNMISLEARSLSEIGSAFILAAALSPFNSGKTAKKTIFRDISVKNQDSSLESGIPIYCWTTENSNRCCLRLTLVDGIPVVKIFCDQSQNIEEDSL